jgi:SAM-dependent methyltransferase
MTASRPAWVDDIFDELVDQPIRSDPRTVAVPGSYLGCQQGVIFSEVLQGGQADFDAPYGALSADDRALLYARYNQRGHFDELQAAFTQLMRDSAGTPNILDLGCGPWTGGLALSAAVGPGRPFRYYGIDRAASMRRLGERFADAARQRGALHPHTRVAFASDLGEVDFGPITDELTIAVASYLLASSTVDPMALAASLIAALSKIGPGPSAVLYTNSAKEYLNEKFPAFRDELERAGFQIHEDAKTTFTKTKTLREIRYALLFRPAPPTIELGDP